MKGNKMNRERNYHWHTNRMPKYIKETLEDFDLVEEELTHLMNPKERISTFYSYSSEGNLGMDTIWEFERNINFLSKKFDRQFDHPKEVCQSGERLALITTPWEKYDMKSLGFIEMPQRIYHMDFPSYFITFTALEKLAIKCGIKSIEEENEEGYKND